jgi:hypothetical protein
MVALAAPALAQQTGAVGGTVRDAQGGVLPGVTVTASGGATAPRSAVSNEQGTYSITGLPPGTYSVVFELAGFSSQTQEARVSIPSSESAPCRRP